MNINEKTYLSIEELVSLPTLSEITISNDGKNVAFVKRTADWKDNAYRNHIWVYEKDKGQCYSLTTNDTDSTCPLWSPDSRHIAYLSGDNQIFVKSIDGYSEVQITDEEEGVIKFKWAPNGKGFYYIAQSKEFEEIKRRKEIYGDFNHVGKEYQNNCLYNIEIEKGIKKSNDKYEYSENSNSACKDKDKNSIAYQLTDGKDFHIHEFDISNNGEKVVFVAKPSPEGKDCQDTDLYILDIKSGKLNKINGNKLLGGSVCFSPNATKICYKASLREKEYYKTHIVESTLEIYDINSGEVNQPLTDFDSTVIPIQWTAKGILIMWQSKTNYLIGLLSEDGNVDMLSEKIDCCIMDASITENGNHIAYGKATSNETFEVYLDHKKITNENSIFNGKLKSNREVISWKSSDDLEIEGVLSTPIEFDSTW